MSKLNAKCSFIRFAQFFSKISITSVLFVSVGSAQVTSGTILGSVVDESGGSVPNARVVITNVGTNIQSVIQTSADGSFEKPYLLPGQYTITVDAAGFRSFVQTGITLNTDEKYRAEIRLQVGSPTQRN